MWTFLAYLTVFYNDIIIILCYMEHLNMSNESLGTLIHGIAAHSALDSSGERMDIEGIDDSSLTKDGIINTEHKNDNSVQIIGKIIESKKILKQSDCKNKHHEYFWEKAGKMPFLYIKAVMFDKFNHPGAIGAVAMAKFDKLLDTTHTNPVCGLSIEGSRLDKQGSTIKKSIIRKVSFTQYPCNKMCIAEICEDDSFEDQKQLSLESMKKLFEKSQKEEIDIKKEEKKYFQGLKSPNDKIKERSATKDKYIPQPKVSSTGTTGGGQKQSGGDGWKPKRTIPAGKIKPNQYMKIGDRIKYRTSGTRRGSDIYNDPNTWKKETNDKNKQILKHIDNAHKKIEKSEILKKISNENWQVFADKEDLLNIIKEIKPELTKTEVLAFAKTYVFTLFSKAEKKLSEE